MRTTPPQERETQQKEARHARHAAVVIDPAAVVERSGIQPVVCRAVACGPDHCSKAGQIELSGDLGEGGRRRLDRKADEGSHVVLVDPLVDATEESGSPSDLRWRRRPRPPQDKAVVPRIAMRRPTSRTQRACKEWK